MMVTLVQHMTTRTVNLLVAFQTMGIALRIALMMFLALRVVHVTMVMQHSALVALQLITVFCITGAVNRTAFMKVLECRTALVILDTRSTVSLALL